MDHRFTRHRWVRLSWLIAVGASAIAACSGGGPGGIGRPDGGPFDPAAPSPVETALLPSDAQVPKADAAHATDAAHVNDVDVPDDLDVSRASDAIEDASTHDAAGPVVDAAPPLTCADLAKCCTEVPPGDELACNSYWNNLHNQPDGGDRLCGDIVESYRYDGKCH